MLKLQLVQTKDEMDQFIRMFNYWHKQGFIGFVPIFILYRARDNCELVILKDSNSPKVLGIAWMIHRKRPYEFYQMKTLAIDSDAVEQGLGKHFLSKLIEPIHNAGFDISTSVLTDNDRALNLYLDMGFKETEIKTSPKGIETYELILPAKPMSKKNRGKT